MAKYDPLRDHLLKQTLGEIVLSFTEIERLIGPLPTSADRPQWWSNVRSPATSHVQREAWREAGYDAFLLAGTRKVRFVRAAKGVRSVPIGRASAAAPIPPPAVVVKPALTAQALAAGGFEVSSRWILTADSTLGLERPLPRSPGVYAFAMRGLVVYVGIASSGLARRLAFYIRPGSTQRKSQRVGARLAAELATVGSIDILTASPPNSVWNGWPINASAGLEVGLIANFDVPWNMRGV